jgi:Subtilase family/MBG domain
MNMRALLCRVLPGVLLVGWPLQALALEPVADPLASPLDEPGLDLSDQVQRERVVARLREIENTRSEIARSKALALGLPLRRELTGGRIQEIYDFDQLRPRYRITHNANAAISTGANLLRSSPYSLNGSGVTIGMWDGGSGRSTHQEFGSRLVVMDGSVSIDHATHVAGTMIASGVSTTARGMAGSAILHSYDWNSDTSEMTSRAASAANQADRLYLSNHSYDFTSGWVGIGGGSPFRNWEWYGSGTSSTAIENDFGVYGAEARTQDSISFNAPYYLIFRSAGNDRTDNPGAGQMVALSPGSTTVVAYDAALHPKGDGSYRGGFETIGYNAVAKNVLTVGSALDAVTSGVRDPAKASSSAFSSWGPTDDGRIKPDVVANGDSLYSSLNSSNSGYGYFSGTSMASPNACGSAALLVGQYNTLFPGQAMRASTLKGLLIHCADDRGNAGPDYKFGWGLLNVKTAADVLIDHQANPLKQRVTEGQVSSTTQSRTQTFLWDGTSPIRATLCWTDPAGTSTTTSDSRTVRLVNNLQLKVVAPDGTQHLPFVMPFVGTWTQASMDQPAVTGINNTDNVEQVHIPTPGSTGTWQVVVSYSGTLTNNLQNYSLILSGSAAEAPPPPPLSLNSISPATGLSGSVVTVDLAGNSLRADTNVRLTRSGQTDIVASTAVMVGESLRCQFNLGGAAQGRWNVVATNPDLQSATLEGAFEVLGAIWSENFDGTVTGWTSEATRGSNSWTLSTTRFDSAPNSYFAPGPNTRTTCSLISPVVAIPTNANNLQLKFKHRYDLQSQKDGGRLELSVDGGTWFLAGGSGTSFVSNGFNSTINSTSNDFGSGAAVWSGKSGSFLETIVNLTDTAKFAGHNLRMRWRIATNSSTSSVGWNVDSISLTGGGDFTNDPPAIVDQAGTASVETQTDQDGTLFEVVRSTETTLAVVASDDGGEPRLTYEWSLANGPASVAFMPNASNAAKQCTAEFQQMGDYQLAVTVRDQEGLSVTSTVNVRVAQAATGLTILPAVASVTVGGSQAFHASLVDQFGDAMATQPAAFDWSVSGGGTVSPAGVFTAAHAGGPFVVTAASGEFANIATVTVLRAPAVITLSGLEAVYDGTPKPVTVTTDPPGLAVSVTYDGSSSPPSAAGNHAVAAMITDPDHQGTAEGTLVIAKAPATVLLSGLDAVYDGTPKPVTVTTDPPGLAVSVTYDGSSSPPSAVGSHAVSAVVTDPNHSGSATGTLVISPGSGWTAWVASHFSVAEQESGQAAASADPDGDGLPNLGEYALGSDPHGFTPPLRAVREEGALAITFTRPAGLADVACTAEASEDLLQWSPATLEVVASDGGVETVRVSVGNAAARRFLRLRFTSGAGSGSSPPPP